MSTLTRRELAAVLSGTALLAQVPPSPVQPSQAQPSADDELKTSRTQLRDNADQLDKFSLPMSAEPATIFRP